MKRTLLRRCNLFRSQRADAQDFILVQWLQSGFWYCRNSDRVPDGVEHFDGVAILAIRRKMMIDNLHDIAAAEPVLGNIACESSISVKFEAHGLSFLRD